MISSVTVYPTTKQIRRIARLCTGHGNETVRLAFHRSRFVRVTIWESDGDDVRGTRYLISPRGRIRREEEV